MVTKRVHEVAQLIFVHNFYGIGTQLKNSQLSLLKAQPVKIHKHDPASITWISGEDSYPHYYNMVRMDGVIYQVNSNYILLKLYDLFPEL